MGWVVFLLALVVSGLVIGALGRLAIPGPDPMSLGMTFVVGIGGSLVGGLVGRLIWGDQYQGSLLLAVAGAALIVWLMGRGRRRARPARRF